MFSEDRPRSVQSLEQRNREQRKHTRVEHNGAVHLISEGGEFSGQAVNISRSGMQIVINLPDSYRSIRSITFTLPSSGKTIELPCKLVRVETGTTQDSGRLLGLEFSYQAEAQLVLIDNFVREIKERELLKTTRSSELRQIPRADCAIRQVDTDTRAVQILSIDNISTRGLLLSFEGQLRPADVFQIKFCLPQDSRPLNLCCRVMYVIGNQFSGVSSAGVLLQDLRQTDRMRIKNYVVSSASSSAMRNLHARFASREIDSRFLVEDCGKITSYFKTLREEETQLYVLFEQSMNIAELHIKGVDPKRKIFTTDTVVDMSMNPGQIPVQAYHSFHLHGGSHYFKCHLEGIASEELRFSYPEVIVQSEKRSYQRKILELGSPLELSLESEGRNDETYIGKLIDISRRGFLCEVALEPGTEMGFKKGQPLNYELNEQLGLNRCGVIRHIKETFSNDGKINLRIGVEAGIQRDGFNYRFYNTDEWTSQVSYPPDSQESGDFKGETVPIRYRNASGQEIAALVNATRLYRKAPVVVLPPAFGKKKEALSPLVLTLLTNFNLLNKDIVTVRYDGINRPGESFNEEKKPKRGYEMLHYRLSQGQKDLRTTLDFVYDNRYFTPERVILVTFSMSALDARKLLSQAEERRVDLWISCMGVPAAQSAYGNILGGIDIIANYKMSIPNGIGGVLGNLIDLDTMAKDLITHKYAYITDARIDMSKIPIPVLWIYGTYDKWLVAEEIKDIMSVKAEGAREAVEIPTGHNLRCGDDAIKNYKLITSYLFEHLYGAAITPVDPAKDQMLSMIAYERERLSAHKDFEPESYWKYYLMGRDEGSFGYDFYANFKEFREFLDKQAELVDPRPRDRIIDMGCGTGLLLESILDLLSRDTGRAQDVRITAVDLVQEALWKAKKRCSDVVRRCPSLESVRLEFLKKDLDPNRLLPVQTFMENPRLDFNYLRNKIKGLRNVTLDYLVEHSAAELYRIMRGKALDADAVRFIEDTFRDGHRSAVLEFNRAARYLRKALVREDFRTVSPSGARLPARDYSGITTGNLIFDTLDFGENNTDFTQGFEHNVYTKVVASLFVSYVFNPELIVQKFYDILVPGGTLLVSSMKPDSDISPMYTRYIDEVRRRFPNDPGSEKQNRNLNAARAMLNEAASLFSLEEEGFFRFYSPEDLAVLLQNGGFQQIRIIPSLGFPPQAVIATGIKPV